MKEIKTDQVLETKIRIYNTWLLERLNNYLKKHEHWHKNKNEFYVSLIEQGLQMAELQDENYSDYTGKLQSISDKLTEFEERFDEVAKAIKTWNNEDMIDHAVFEKILSRILKLTSAENEGYKVDKKFLEAGMYDLLPNDIDEYKYEMQVAMGIKKKPKSTEK